MVALLGLRQVGVLLFTPYCLIGYDRACAHVDAFCKSQGVVPERRTRDQLLLQRDDVLQIALLFPPLEEDTAEAGDREDSLTK